jgi:hypothetical protein
LESVGVGDAEPGGANSPARMTLSYSGDGHDLNRVFRDVSSWWRNSTRKCIENQIRLSIAKTMALVR